MKNLWLILLIFPMLFSCTIDKFDGEFNVEAEILNIGSRMVSIKYKLGVSEIYDDLIMKDKTAILSEWKYKGFSVVPLKVVIEGYSEEGNKRKFSLKYYYKSNLICDSQNFDFNAIRVIAADNEEIFNWECKDGTWIKDEEEKKEQPKSTTPVKKSEKGSKL